MDAASVSLIAFGLVVALLSNAGRDPRWRLVVLLLASALFLYLLAPGLVSMLPFAGFLLLGYLAIVAIRGGLPRAVPAGVVAILLVYIWLKRYSFLPAQSLLAFPYFLLGLSYIFFRVLHLVIEAGAPGPARQIRPLYYLAYTLNFTTLISGPIQRYPDFSRDQEVVEPIPLDASIVGRQLERIIVGFFKVNVLGLLFSMFHTDAVAELARPDPLYSRMFAALKIVGSYPLFLYCNFSGYIDIVIAIARLMRLRLPENFDRPFSATSFLDLWNRWHITLSSWLKTYVYNPLLIALMRRDPSASREPVFGILCFFVTFFLIGIWHGRTSEFAVYGVLLGLGAAINKYWQVTMARRLGRKAYRQLARGTLYAAVARGLTYTWFALSLVWFWASWQQIGAAVATIGAGLWLIVLLCLWLIATIALSAWETLRPHLIGLRVNDIAVLDNRYSHAAFVAVLGAIAFLMTAVLSQPAPGIVYRTF